MANLTISSRPLLISKTTPTLSFVAAKPPWATPGWATARSALDEAVGAYNLHVNPFGQISPWKNDKSGPLETRPSLWHEPSRFGWALAKVREISQSKPIITTAYNGDWFMRKVLGSDGSTRSLSYADRFSDDGRITIDQIENWGYYLDGMVDCMVRYGSDEVQIWNEGKGFYQNPQRLPRRWDASMNPGTPGNADMGYSFLYQWSGRRICQRFSHHGIARQRYKIGGPYPVLSSKGALTADAVPSSHPFYQYRHLFGLANVAPLRFLEEFLGHAQARDFEFDKLLVDISTFLQDGQYPTDDPFVINQKFTIYFNYLRALLAAFAFDPDMPLDVSEIYSFPPPALQTPGQYNLRAALWIDTLRQCIHSQVRYPMIWGALGEAQGKYSEEGGLITDPMLPGGGTLTLTGEAMAYITKNFGAGTLIHQVNSDDPRVRGIGSRRRALIYNISPHEIPFTIRRTTFTLEPYGHQKVAL